MDELTTKENRARGRYAPPTRFRYAPTRGSFHAFLSVLILLSFAAAGAANELPAGKEHPLQRVDHPGDPSLMLYFDFEGPVFIEHGQVIKDHSFIEVSGLYHIFYITDGGKSFGHASSADLRHWTVHDRVLEAGTGFTFIWAPHIVPCEDIPGFYLMYFTGVNQDIAQETNLAYSSGDLSSWIVAAPELFRPYHPDTTWAAWNENQWSNCRDPFFFSDDDGRDYLINTATSKEATGAISLAEVTGYFEWEDIGPLYIHNNWHALESSFLLKRSGTYHLFFVEETVGGISHLSSPSLTGGWNMIYRAIIDNGHACEILQTGSGDYLFSRHSSYALPTDEIVYSIRIDTLAWLGDLPEVSIADPLDGDWTILHGTAFDRQPVFGNPFHYRGDDSVDPGHEGNWWIGTYESYDGPLLGSVPGAFQGDSPRGAIRSKTFTASGRSMRLLVGGGDYPDSCYVALCDAGSGKILRKETGRGVDTMDERIWDIEPWQGRQLYLEIVDICSGPFGHINVDGITESPFPARNYPHDDDPSTDKGVINPEKYFSGQADREPPADEGETAPGIPAISCYPNPFNPSTRISFTGEPGRVYSIAIYAVDGRKVAVVPAAAESSGTGSAVWDGRLAGGDIAASGVYAAALTDRGRIVSVCKMILLR